MAITAATCAASCSFTAFSAMATTATIGSSTMRNEPKSWCSPNGPAANLSGLDPYSALSAEEQEELRRSMSFDEVFGQPAQR